MIIGTEEGSILRDFNHLLMLKYLSNVVKVIKAIYMLEEFIFNLIPHLGSIEVNNE